MTEVAREPSHIKCPICGATIKENKKLTHDIKWDKTETCYNEFYLHIGETLYKRTFHGHKFPKGEVAKLANALVSE